MPSAHQLSRLQAGLISRQGPVEQGGLGQKPYILSQPARLRKHLNRQYKPVQAANSSMQHAKCTSAGCKLVLSADRGLSNKEAAELPAKGLLLIVNQGWRRHHNCVAASMSRSGTIQKAAVVFHILCKTVINSTEISSSKAKALWLVRQVSLGTASRCCSAKQGSLTVRQQQQLQQCMFDTSADHAHCICDMQFSFWLWDLA